MKKEIQNGSKIITDEIVIAELKKFKEDYSEIGEDIRYKSEGYDVSMPELVDEIIKNTELGKQIKGKLVRMALMNLLDIFKLDSSK